MGHGIIILDIVVVVILIPRSLEMNANRIAFPFHSLVLHQSQRLSREIVSNLENENKK